MTYIIIGFLSLLGAIVSWFPAAGDFQIPVLNVVAKNVGAWIDIPAILTVISLMVGIQGALGVAFLVNWIIKRVRGG